jgi:hypothetical protein
MHIDISSRDGVAILGFAAKGELLTLHVARGKHEHRNEGKK